MSNHSVYEKQPEVGWVRFPQSFSNKEAANTFVFRRKQLPAFKDTEFEVREDDPEQFAEEAKRFIDA